MKLGAQYFTIREFCQSLEDFDASCKKVADMGYSIVQLSGIGDFSGEDIRKILDKYNLKVVATHRPADKYLSDIEGEIAFHKAIGCDVCGIGSMPGFSADNETVDNFVEKFTPVAKALSEAGLTFGFHNHALELRKENGKFVFDIISERMAGTGFKYILDVYWLAFAGINPAKFIEERGNDVACVHLKDLKVVDNEVTFAEVGSGNLNWQEIIESCEKAGVEYALVEQDSCDGDPFCSLKISFDYIEKNFPHII